MALLGIDLGGTKLALAIIEDKGKILLKETVAIGSRRGAEVGILIANSVRKMLRSGESAGNSIVSIGISVPGISHIATGRVWAPNIQGWDDYPLLQEIQAVSGQIPVTIDSDRACYILGEAWKGNAKGCRDAIFLSVGTGIGAGILINGEILRGSHDIAGCIGWMALKIPYENKYKDCGCFEYYSSGEGIARLARNTLKELKNYSGKFSSVDPESITSSDVFMAYNTGDDLAVKVIESCVGFWGMAVANLVSLFNPEKIIFGGGVFGPGIAFIPDIKKEAEKWAQPISIHQVSLDASGLAGDAGVTGAGYLALKRISGSNK